MNRKDKKEKEKKGGLEASPPPPTPTLDEEIRNSWCRPLSATPINKDLPRLATRIHVIVNENSVLAAVPLDVVEASMKAGGQQAAAVAQQETSSETSRKLMNSVEYRMSIVLRNNPDWVKALQLPPEVVKQQAAGPPMPTRPPPPAPAPAPAKSAPAEEKKDQFPIWVTRSLPAAVVEKRRATDCWTAWDGPGYLRLRPPADGGKHMGLEVRMKTEAQPFALGSSANILEMLDSSRYFALRAAPPDGGDASWTGFAFHTRQEAAQFKDLIHAPPPPPVPPPAGLALGEGADSTSPREHESMKVIRPVAKVVLEVARSLEPKDTVARFEQAFRQLGEQRAGDLEVFLPDVWRAGGEDSRTARVFKAIHQNIIFVAIYHIKKALPAVMTRDVRTPEGWQIYVHILPDVVVITHSRREQALASVPESDYFWYEWQLRMIFDFQLNDMRAARLRIVNLGFGEKTTPEKRVEYTKMFGGGNIILY